MRKRVAQVTGVLESLRRTSIEQLWIECRGTIAWLISNRAEPIPFPGWYLGIGESDRGIFSRLRRKFWCRLTEPVAIPWIDGLRVYAHPKDEITRAIFLTGLFEPSSFFMLDKLIKPGMTFIDVGANLGLYT
jgi:hypothetical protein